MKYILLSAYLISGIFSATAQTPAKLKKAEIDLIKSTFFTEFNKHPNSPYSNIRGGESYELVKSVIADTAFAKLSGQAMSDSAAIVQGLLDRFADSMALILKRKKPVLVISDTLWGIEYKPDTIIRKGKVEVKFDYRTKEDWAINVSNFQMKGIENYKNLSPEYLALVKKMINGELPQYGSYNAVNKMRNKYYRIVSLKDSASKDFYLFYVKLSRPVFNAERTKACYMYELLRQGSSKGAVLLFAKKEKGKWLWVGTAQEYEFAHLLFK